MTRAKALSCACGGVIVKGARCLDCLNLARREQMARKRSIGRHACACGVMIGKESKACRRCNLSALGSGKVNCARCGAAIVCGRCGCHRTPAAWADERSPAPKLIEGRWEAWAAERDGYDPARSRFIDAVDARYKAR